MAHYLLAVSPLSGHVLPMVHIGAGLQSLGHAVTVMTGAAFEQEVRQRGLRFVALPDGARIDPPAAAPWWTKKLNAQVRRFVVGRSELAAVFVTPLALQTTSLRTLLEREPVDAILADVTFTGVLPLLLDGQPRPPVLVCGVGPLTLSSADTPPFGMAWLPESGVDYRPMTSVAHRIIMGHSQRRFNDVLRTAGCGPAPVFISDWPRLADGVLQLGVEAFEYPRSDLPDSVRFVGPVLPDSAQGDLPSWWEDVVRARTVVHVTQGTFDNTDLGQLITSTVAALADRPDVLVVATTGRPVKEPVLEAVPSNARIVEWLPYAALLPHVDVMVTNGGYGGVQYALSNGVPLVVAGETSDKAEIAARVEYSGAGVNLHTATPSEAAIREAVERVLAEPRYRSAAEALRVDIAATHPVDAIAAALDDVCAAAVG